MLLALAVIKWAILISLFAVFALGTVAVLGVFAVIVLMIPVSFFLFFFL